MATLRQTVQYRIEADPSDILKDLASIGRSWGNLQKKFEDGLEGDATVGGAGAGAGGVGGVAAGAAAGKASRKSAALGAAAAAGSVYKAIAPLAVGYGVNRLGRAAIESAAQLESLQKQFEVFYGSVNDGNRELARTLKAARESSFDALELVATRRQLKAFGIDSERALNAVQDAAAGTGKELEVVSGALAYLNAGVLGEGMERMRRMGITMEMLADAGAKFNMKTRKFLGTNEELVTAAFRVIEERFGGLSKELVDTWKGATTNLGDAWKQALAGMGKSLQVILLPAVKEATSALAAYAQEKQREAGIYDSAQTEVTDLELRMADLRKELERSGSGAGDLARNNIYVVNSFRDIAEITEELASLSNRLADAKRREREEYEAELEAAKSQKEAEFAATSRGSLGFDTNPITRNIATERRGGVESMMMRFERGLSLVGEEIRKYRGGTANDPVYRSLLAEQSQLGAQIRLLEAELFQLSEAESPSFAATGGGSGGGGDEPVLVDNSTTNLIGVDLSGGADSALASLGE